jgi:hypothetical protein
MSNKPYQRNLPVPFFSQRDNKYEWQRITKEGGEDFRRINAGKRGTGHIAVNDGRFE